jgi:hypothetical protein
VGGEVIAVTEPAQAWRHEPWPHDVDLDAVDVVLERRDAAPHCGEFADEVIHYGALS